MCKGTVVWVIVWAPHCEGYQCVLLDLSLDITVCVYIVVEGDCGGVSVCSRVFIWVSLCVYMYCNVGGVSLSVYV